MTEEMWNKIQNGSAIHLAPLDYAPGLREASRYNNFEREQLYGYRDEVTSFLREHSPRKLSLFFCACLRRQYPEALHVPSELEAGERILAGVGGTEDADTGRALVERVTGPRSNSIPAEVLLTVAYDRSDALCEGDLWPYFGPEMSAQCELLCEIFGNPFRPVHFDPAWRTDTALTLARQMYEAREFGAAPILADALQDAGCDADDLLNHLRDASAVHVRGCWALDLVLGKA